MRSRATFPVLLMASCLLGVRSQAALRELSFEDRVRAQAAIERVRYQHQLGATKFFAEAVPRAVLEAKVREYLRQSVALAEYWKTPIDDRMLQREVERMAAASRMPDRLRELFAALNDDPVLVKECLARAALADRLTRNFFAFDPALHASAREAAEKLVRRLDTDSLNALEAAPERALIEYSVGDAADDGTPRAGEPYQVHLSAAELSATRKRLLAGTPGIARMQDARDAYAVTVVLSAEDEALRVARYNVPKLTWSDWWESAGPKLDEARITSVATSELPLPVPGGGRTAPAFVPCTAGDSWDNGILDDVPTPRLDHTLVWTGSVVVVWGGYNGSYLKSGSRYDPATDQWTPTTVTEAPFARSRHTAIWTGTEMVVWGGYLQTGGRYDPLTDSWIPTSDIGAPSARADHTAVWTGDEMIVWGGNSGGNLNTGGRYNPATDTWVATATIGAPAARSSHTAVWTEGAGNPAMVVWGGEAGVNTGGRYYPATDSWAPTTTSGAPTARRYHSAVWTGFSMVVWGGVVAGFATNTGAIYNSVTDVWTPTTTTGAPAGRDGHTVVWTGSAMLVWAGADATGAYLNSGALFDPFANSWVATGTAGAPSVRKKAPGVWTGSLFVTWGGVANGAGVPADSGGRYDPASGTWTPTYSPSTPTSRASHTAVWTGNVMVLWGGQDTATSTYFNSGAKYDPVLDNWTFTGTSGAPVGRYAHTAVWTGDRMIVWGGRNSVSGGYLDSGGVYDPVANSWLATSSTNAPSARYLHAAVWTGTVMVVWGGNGASTGYYTGGRYNPSTNTWLPTATNGPVGRSSPTAVWTGTRMIIWGGNGVGGTQIPGGSYDPATNRWTEITTTGAPPEASAHSAVWTGSRMIVWGDGTAGRYDPSSDSWAPMSTYGAPVDRTNHTAVWTGSRMIVWGGRNGAGSLGNGGRYDPVTDSWSPTTNTGAPTARYAHSAAWTGSSMIIWGGTSGSNPSVRSGGRYEFEAPFDVDGDGFAGCQGDCNDGNIAVYPGANELCDGADNDCDGVVDEGVVTPTLYRDQDGDGFGDPSLFIQTCAFPAGYSPAGTDCNDASAAVNPAAAETCNLIDDDCDLAVDEGIAAPGASADLRLSKLAGTTVSWQPVAAATEYDVVRGELSVLRATNGDFSLATGACLANNTSSTTAPDGAPASAGGGFWYVVRPINCGGAGSYDSGSPAQTQSRNAEIAGSGSACP